MTAPNQESEGGYLMAKSIEIKNFRGFKHAKLSDCSRINVIVGDNGSGKTALLEAIFIAAGCSAELSLRVKNWRGIEMGEIRGTTQQITESLWADLFYNFQVPSRASVSFSGGPPHHNRSLDIDFAELGETKISIGKDESQSSVRNVESESPIRFKWKLPGNKTVVSTATLEEGKLNIKAPFSSPLDAVFIAAHVSTGGLDTVARYSYLSKELREEKVLQVFKTLFPQVEDISIELSAGRPTLFAKVKGRPQKIPLGLLSGGMAKLSALLFAIPNFTKGIVVVDEIENGFHYSRFSLLWNAIEHFATEYDVQVFASTHSSDCLRAVAELAKEKHESFTLIRTIKSEKDGCIVRQFSGKQFSAASEFDLEIR